MNKKHAAIIGVICLIVGIAASFQYKYFRSEYHKNPGQIDKLKQELKALREERASLNEQLESVQQQLGEISGAASKESVIVKNLTDDLNRYRAFVGLTKLSGPGLIITLDNPASEQNYSGEKNLAYDYRLILDLMNELYSSGAEAVSINEQRIINNSEIRLAGRQLNVNMIPLAPPFVVKVIGDYETLNGAIMQRFGVISGIRKQGYYAEVKKMEELEILPYKGVLRFEYGEVVK